MKSKNKRLKDKLDKIVSKYIRLRDKGICYTCGKEDDPKRQHAGHYVKRSCMRLRWDERNINCQCPRCNLFLGGNMDEYALHLQKDYGEEILKDLNRQKHLPVKIWKIRELEELLEDYKLKLKEYELENK